MNLLGLIPTVVRVAGKLLGKGDAAEDLAAAVEGMPPEKRAELEAQMATHELELRKVGLEEIRLLVDESLVATKSEDKWVSRARPTGLYAAYAITTALAVALMLGVKIDTGAIVTIILPLYGNAMWYTRNRTLEKLGK